MNADQNHLLVYHKNPYLCSLYAQYLLTFAPKFFSSILVTCPVELYRIRQLMVNKSLSCVVFDSSDFPIVELEMKGFARTYLINCPEDRDEVVMQLGGVS